MTAQEMCEAVARHCSAEHNGRVATADQIWRSICRLTPTGELWPLFEFYDRAVAAGFGIHEEDSG